MATAMSLIKNTTINSEEKELHQELEAQSTDILAKISDPEYQLSVLIIGASQTGKTSLVANMFGTEASDSLEKLGIIIGKDGSPTTQDVRSVFLPELKLNLIDTPGLEKDRRVNRARQIVSEIRSKKLEPNVIWLVVNLQGSIEEVELELVKSFPNAPVLLILNKVDILQNHKTELNTDSRCLEQFDQLSKPELPQWMQKYNKLMAVRERLFNWQKNHVSIRRVLITSMKQEGDDDDNPIGLDEVYAATWSCLDTVGRITLTNTQQKSKRGKLALSVSTVLTAAAAAGGAAWIPVPFVDSAVITSIQIAMIISLYKLWGVAGSGILVDPKTFCTVFIKSMAGPLISFGVGFSLANLIKLIPGVGTIIGGVSDTIIGTVATLVVGGTAVLYLSTWIYTEHQLDSQKALEQHLNEFMSSDRYKTFLSDMKRLAKNPTRISRSAFSELFS